MQKVNNMENNLEILALSFLGVLFLVGVSIIIIDKMEEKRKIKTEGKNKPEPIYDEEHAFDQAMNKMLDDFTDEEIQDLIDESKSKDPKDEVQ